MAVGDSVGSNVGDLVLGVGSTVESTEGPSVGTSVESYEGYNVGTADKSYDGRSVGTRDGCLVGNSVPAQYLPVGNRVGAEELYISSVVGANVGRGCEGLSDGTLDGPSVGAREL